MSILTKVYAPNGEAFELPHERANDLVLNKGWTKSRVEDVPVLEMIPHEPDIAPVEVEEPVAPSRYRRKKSSRLAATELDSSDD